MKKGWLLTAGWLVTLVLFIVGCNGQPRESPTITETQNTILEISVSHLSLSCPPAVPPDIQYKTARMKLRFLVHNQDDDTAVILDKFEYAVYGEDYTVTGTDTMVRGESLNLNIAPGGETELSFPLPYIFKDDNPALWSEMIKGNVTWRIEGTAYILTYTENLSVPFGCTVENYSIDMGERCLEGE
jgi:hypothetical protein